ncbi:MAG: CDP-diacylglycerol--serine O-phosphatidyltransferase [Acidobacteriota bacterium]
MNRDDVRRVRRRGVYVIPTSLTVLNIFFGFMAILLSFRGMQATVLGDNAEAAHLFQRACWSLLVAAVFDTFDGLVARLMNATSEFGKEYDSLADVVTFGAAPAILVYSWSLHVWGRLGGGIAFLFLVAGSLRLARFNISTAKVDHRYFIGLPIPAGALTIASIINYAPSPVTDPGFAAVMLVVTAGLAFAMVSTVRYRSQKYANLQKERSFAYVIVLALMLVIFYRWPEEFLFVSAISYVVSGPLLKLWSIAFPAVPAGPSHPDDGDVVASEAAVNAT